MTDLKNLQMLLRYNAWANDRIFTAVTKLNPPDMPEEQTTLLTSIAHDLHHAYIVNLIWQAYLEDRQHGFTTRRPKEHPPLNELWRAQQEIDAWYSAYSNQLAPDTADELIAFTLIGGNKGTMTRAEILLHIVNHTTYHRGYVADMLCQIPMQPPATDFTIFFEHTRGVLHA